MNKLAHSLIGLAVFSHVGLSVMDAYARGSSGGGSHGSFSRPSGGFGGGSFGGSNYSGGQSYSGNGTKGNGGKGGYGSYEGDEGNGGSRTVGTYPGNPYRGDGNNEGNGGYRPAPPRLHNGFAPVDFDQPASSAGSGGGECEGGLQLSAINEYADPVEGLAKISRETTLYVDNCNGSAALVADALDRYAQALTKIAPRLPPELKSLPQIVASAAHRARQAKTKPAAVQVLRAAVVAIHAAVHKAIELMRASDSDATTVATRSADLVARTVASAASSLARADSI